MVFCKHCNEAIIDGQQWVQCPECGEYYHYSCWQMEGGCGTPGCAYAPEKPAIEAAQPEQPAEETKVDVPSAAKAELRCPVCHAVLQENQHFCPSCGAEVNTAAPVSCPNCGAAIQPGQRFCSRCRYSLNNSMPNSSAHRTRAASGAAQSRPHTMRTVLITLAFIVLLGAFGFGAYSLINVMRVTPEKLSEILAQGDYAKAYNMASEEEKQAIALENLIAYTCIEVPDNLKNPSSFSLRNAWYDHKENRIVLSVNGTNSYGGLISNYWYYTYEADSQRYELYTAVSDLDEEEIYSWDDSLEAIEKMLDNFAKEEIGDIIRRDEYKLKKDQINNINFLFENDLLDSVTLLDVWKPSITNNSNQTA